MCVAAAGNSFASRGVLHSDSSGSPSIRNRVGAPALESKNANRGCSNRKIATLPVKTQSSQALDSVLSLRNEIKRPGKGPQSKLSFARITDSSNVAEQINQKGGLLAFDPLLSADEHAGVIDKRQFATLGHTLRVAFLLLSRLKAEKMDLVISRGSPGEWKRSRMFDASKALPDEAADSLVHLAFAGVTSSYEQD